MPPLDDAKMIAAKFLAEQAAIIRKYGDDPHVSGSRYQEAIVATQKAFEAMSNPEK